jgi:hypothetical protein
MGIYVFKKDVMVKLLKEDPTLNDFGGEIIPKVSPVLYWGQGNDLLAGARAMTHWLGPGQ